MCCLPGINRRNLAARTGIPNTILSLLITDPRKLFVKMSFHLSADNIHLVDDHILRASLRREDGEFQDAEIDLNSFIGNEDGMIHWDGRGQYTRINL